MTDPFPLDQPAHPSNPHETNTTNKFKLNRTRSAFYMVDIPGVGYAKVPLAEKSKWVTFFEVRLSQCVACDGGW